MTTVKAEESSAELPTQSESVDTCYMQSHSVMVVVTGGTDKPYSYSTDFYDDGGDADDWPSIQSSALSSMHCPSSPTAASAMTTSAGSTQTAGNEQRNSATTASETASAGVEETSSTSDPTSPSATGTDAPKRHGIFTGVPKSLVLVGPTVTRGFFAAL
ncbi:unnamed protein product [Clonostachys chloroleuca]|uniref:Uncharacterized protein n=1 Tax=Clonostachys chloroleuca TaxID=1926264 RepID=A0AA35M556_9HYPO|nr:unnamed protein product [Clonostachys chloroleuca]